jgi:nicotinate-nucleotide pyrophosphorylase (carboxylating)
MFLFDASKELVLKNPVYKKMVELYVWQAYLQDLGSGDATSNLFLKAGQKKVTAQIVANESFILAGVQEAKWFLGRVGIRLVTAIKDGSSVKKGDTIMKMSCNPKKILSAERTLLNLLQRMSGVATATNKLASKLPKNIKLLATRKTLWGMLDKRAVSVGGGCTHRLNLDDAILIKENHLSLSDNPTRDFKQILNRAENVRFVEIELQIEKEVKWLLKNFSNPDSHVPLVAMLDNMNPQQVKKFAPLLKKSGYIVEISGGVNEKNILSFCVPGVSAISSGSITMKAVGIDISLNF